MKSIINTLATLLLFCCVLQAQEVVYPTKEYKGRLFITNGTVHIGNGTV